MRAIRLLMSARVTRDDWCAAGLEVLRDHGYGALTIDRICTALAKTKGSFYHHFPDLDAYLSAVLERWENDLTELPISASRSEPSPKQRQARLEHIVIGLDHELDRAVRAWSLRDARARSAVQKVDQRRIGYLEQLHREAKSEGPRTLAELEYAIFLGCQALDVFTDARRSAKLSRATSQALAQLARPRKKR